MESDLRAKLMAIQRDPTLTDKEKAIKRQALFCAPKWVPKVEEETKKDVKAEGEIVFADNLKCVICMDVCAMPVTSPCQHNFCLKCLQKWTRSGKKTCPSCRAPFSKDFIANPRINTMIVALIRAAKSGSMDSDAAKRREKTRLELNKERPDEAFTTENAQKTGLANAASGRLMVTCPTDLFGPIGPEYDPERSVGLRVGDFWPNRLACRQYGAHFPHVAGIAGQSDRGAQSVVLSGGYEDDQDHGSWFLYTGSGGRDLSGNKRTNKVHDFDQEFTKYNAALKISCELGLPLRVVRSHKEKVGNFAPAQDVAPQVRYDGIYRVERCWRKKGLNQNSLMCRYLMVRCDNDPAPWSTEDHGDTQETFNEAVSVAIRELEGLPREDKRKLRNDGPVVGCVENIHDRKKMTEEEKEDDAAKKEEWYKAPVVDFFDRSSTGESPAWDWIPEKKCWGWTCAPPRTGQSQGKKKNVLTEAQLFHKRFACSHQKKKGKTHILREPVTAPCGHSFCRACLTDLFKNVGDEVQRSTARSFRRKKCVKICTVKGCGKDITDCVNNLQINRELDEMIKKMMAKLDIAYELGEEEAAAPAPAGACESAGASGGAATGLTSSYKLKYDVVQMKAQPKPIDALAEEFPDVDRGLIEMLLADQDGDAKDVRIMLSKMTNQASAKKQKT